MLVFEDAGVSGVSKSYINTPSSATSKSKLAPVALPQVFPVER